MKIKETVERECCQEKDLKNYLGYADKPRGDNPRFCIHCGQVWIKITEADDLGYSSTMRKPLILGTEEIHDQTN